LCPKSSACLCILVLYSHEQKVWKIADFGLASVATSNLATSIFQRGTAGFRAPELLSEDPKSSNKVDIWAMGCILFQLCTRRPLFQSDFGVREFDRSKFKLEAHIPEAGRSHLSQCLLETLKKEPPLRPSILSLMALFDSYCVIWDPSFAKILESANSFPSYLKWKEFILSATRRPCDVMNFLVNSYFLKGDNEVLEPLLKVAMETFTQGIALHERLENFPKAEEDSDTATTITASTLTDRLDVLTLNNDLYFAVAAGQDSKVASLLNDGVNPNAIGLDSRTALQTALRYKHTSVALLLLKSGADPNANGEGYFETPLQAAAAMGSQKLVSLLLEKGADANAPGGGTTGPALQTAILHGHDEVVPLLLEKGFADMNANGGSYGNALQTAAAFGRLKILRLLLEKGADVNAPGGSSYGTALQVAATYGNKEVVSTLLAKGAHVNVKGGIYGNALKAAEEGRHKTVESILLAHGARK
jgi:ankyrin repeat protein